VLIEIINPTKIDTWYIERRFCGNLQNISRIGSNVLCISQK